MRKPAPKRRVIPAALEEPSGSRAVKETFATGAVESQEHAGGFGHGVENEGGNGVPMEPRREKIKTKGKDRAVLKDSDDSDNGPESDEGGDKADDQRQADVSDPAPAGWKFGVSQRVYDTFEKYFGTDKGTRRNEVAWVRFPSSPFLLPLSALSDFLTLADTATDRPPPRARVHLLPPNSRLRLVLEVPSDRSPPQ